MRIRNLEIAKIRNRKALPLSNSLESSALLFIDSTLGPEGVQYYFSNDDTIGESLRKYGEWARLEMNFLSQFIKKGDQVLDIGSNVGTHTMFFSNLVGSPGNVVSIDAQIGAVTLVGLTALAQRRENLNLLNVAVGKDSGFSYIKSIDYSQPSNFGAVAISNHANSKLRRIALDSLQLREVNFVKMDIEGGELSALNGMLKTIAKDRPIISCEITSEAGLLSLEAFFAKVSYKTELVEISAFNPQNYKKSKENIFGDATERLLLARP